MGPVGGACICLSLEPFPLNQGLTVSLSSRSDPCHCLEELLPSVITRTSDRRYCVLRTGLALKCPMLLWKGLPLGIVAWNHHTHVHTMTPSTYTYHACSWPSFTYTTHIYYPPIHTCTTHGPSQSILQSLHTCTHAHTHTRLQCTHTHTHSTSHMHIYHRFMEKHTNNSPHTSHMYIINAYIYHSEIYTHYTNIYITPTSSTLHSIPYSHTYTYFTYYTNIPDNIYTIYTHTTYLHTQPTFHSTYSQIQNTHSAHKHVL